MGGGASVQVCKAAVRLSVCVCVCMCLCVFVQSVSKRVSCGMHCSSPPPRGSYLPESANTKTVARPTLLTFVISKEADDFL